MILPSWLARFVERHVCAPAPEPRIDPRNIQPLPRYAACFSPHPLRASPGHEVVSVYAFDDDGAWAIVAGGVV